MMARFKSPLILCFAGALAFALAGGARAATYTITGKAYFPDGSPAARVNLLLAPHTGKGLDLLNAYWKIPGYDFHPVTTAADGSFTMSNVQDYPQNTTHRYIIWYDGPSPFYHATIHVLLGSETAKQVEVRLKAATALRLHLTNRDGSPYNGSRAIYLQSGALGQGPTKGVSYVETVNFVDGVGILKNVVIKDSTFFQGRVGILDFADAREAKAWMDAHGEGYNDTDQPLRLYVMKDGRGVPLNHESSLVQSGYTDLTYSLQ